MARGRPRRGPRRRFCYAWLDPSQAERTNAQPEAYLSDAAATTRFQPRRPGVVTKEISSAARCSPPPAASGPARVRSTHECFSCTHWRAATREIHPMADPQPKPQIIDNPNVHAVYANKFIAGSFDGGAISLVLGAADFL